MTYGLNAIRSNDRAAPTDTNHKNLELAPPQSITATRLDQLVYSPNYYIQIFRLNLMPLVVDFIFRDFFWFTLFVLGMLKLTCGGRGEGNCVSSVFSLACLMWTHEV